MTMNFEDLRPYLQQSRSIYQEVGGKYTPDQVIKMAMKLYEGSGKTGKKAGATKILGQMEREFMETNPSSFGPLARVTGFAKNIGGAIGLAPDVTQYQASISSSVAPIIRALGDSGALSDSDKAMAIKSLPTIYDSKEEAQKKFNYLRSILQ